MGLFDKLKNVLKKKENNEEPIKSYDTGLEKTRKEFVNELSMLGIKYKKVSEDYFEELENLLIMADIGVKTVFSFLDRLKNNYNRQDCPPLSKEW